MRREKWLLRRHWQRVLAGAGAKLRGIEGDPIRRGVAEIAACPPIREDLAGLLVVRDWQCVQTVRQEG